MLEVLAEEERSLSLGCLGKIQSFKLNVSQREDKKATVSNRAARRQARYLLWCGQFKKTEAFGGTGPAISV